MKKYNYQGLVILVFLGWISYGISGNLRALTMPLIQENLGFNSSFIGVLFGVNECFYFLSLFFSIHLIKKIGLSKTLQLSFLFLTLAGLMLGYVNNISNLILAYCLQFIAHGLLEICLGILAARIFTENLSQMFNLSQFFYGLGAAFAPYLAMFLLGFGQRWQDVYLYSLPFFALIIIYILFFDFPNDTKNQGNGKNIDNPYKEKMVWFLGITIGCCVFIELSISGQWISIYLQNYLALDIKIASLVLSLFFVLFMFSRLFMGKLSEYIGYLKSVKFMVLGAIIFIFLGLVLNVKGIYLFSLSGFCLAICYPTLIAYVIKIFGQNSDEVISASTSIMSLVNIVLNILMGFIFDGFGAFFGMLFIILIGFLALFFIFLMKKESC